MAFVSKIFMGVNFNKAKKKRFFSMLEFLYMKVFYTITSVESWVHLKPTLIQIYKACPCEGYIFHAWTKIKIRFIPKRVRATQVSLTSFVLKIFGRLLDSYIRLNLPPDSPSQKQHAYSKGKSVDTALQDLVGCTETALYLKYYTLDIFLAKGEAFNNILSKSTMQYSSRNGSPRAHNESCRVSSKKYYHQLHKRPPSERCFIPHGKVKRWHLRPNVVYWIYSSVVRSILTYVLWPEFGEITFGSKLEIA